MTEQTIAAQFPWAVVGAEAVIFEQDHWGHTGITKAKISRVGKTRITLEGGRQFHVPKWRDELREWGRDVYRSPTLIPVDDPRIAEAAETHRKEQIRLKARDAADRYRQDSHSEEKARAAIAALQAFLEAWVEAPPAPDPDEPTEDMGQ